MKQPHLSRKKYMTAFLLLILLTMLSTMLIACQSTPPAEASSDTIENEPASDLYAGKKVLFINSYHEGYEWSDGIESGLNQGLVDTGIETLFVRMDTKQNPEEAMIELAAEDTVAQIEAFQPDVIITADDNAQKFVVVPYLMDTDYPVIFVGVNWDASTYGFPTEHITGMVEIELVEELINHLKEYAEGESVGYVTVGSETEDKVVEVYNERFFDGQLRVYRVSTWDEFKSAFMQAQDEVDIVFLGNNAGTDWDISEAEQFFNENTGVPTGTINSWMAPYALITLAKDPQEQGEWAATTALEILDGTPVSSIATAENKRGSLILNFDIADQMDITFSPALLRNAEIYESGSGS